MTSPAVSRRAVVGGAAAGAVAALIPVATAGAATRPVPARSQPGLVRRRPRSGTISSRDGYLSRDPDLHLLRRLTFGPTPASIAEIKRLGATAWFERQLAPASIKDPVCDGVLATLPRLGWSIARTRDQLDNGSWDVMFDLGVAAVARAVWSERQLFEVMVDFWSNHLNVTNPSSDVWDSRHRYDADVIRAHTFGRFADMLKASAQHPAMLHYLDNADSSKYSPNENYGRELLELHTVGVEAGYTEAEMLDSVRIMTGFSLDWDTGQFLYRRNYHWTGQVSALGFTSANTSSDGRAVAFAFLDHLARHPATARHVATKLYRRFIGDEPTEAAVATLAKAYLAADTAITPMLRALFALPQFRVAPGIKVRRPFEAVVAGLRTLAVGPPTTRDAADYRTGLNALYWQVGDLAHAPLAWNPPDGYPDEAAAWQSASGLVGRWNTHLSHAAGWWPSRSDGMLRYPDLATFLPSPLPATYGEVVDALSRRVVHRTMRSSHRAALLAFMGKAATAKPKATDGALTWRLPYAVALLLDSPYHGYR